MTATSQRTPEEILGLDFGIERIGEPTIDSQVADVPFVADAERVSYFADSATLERLLAKTGTVPGFTRAGPRRCLFHDPPWSRAAIVACGGLCPGINDVIRALVNTLYHTYGVDNVFGVRYGFRGLVPEYGLEPVLLDPDNVDLIHDHGGSILGASRGAQSTDEIVKSLDRLNINMLFTIGGDGTQRGARDIAIAAAGKGVACSVVGIPKTIDNDLDFMVRTFGFESAVYASSPVISCAHEEAKGAYNGIGLVRLMGRDSGFIAASATLANSVVNFCLVPEVRFALDGPGGLLPALAKRLEEKHHVVVVVAEGAGQDLFGDRTTGRDESGNLLHQDIGVFLRERIGQYLDARGVEHSMKYFDPSYLIRSVPAQGTDAVFCLHLAENAVHAAMAGLTNLVVGYWNGSFTYVPINLAVASRRKIDPQSQLWQSVLTTTRQHAHLRAR